MIYLDMNGKIGSQMFRYAFARNLQELYGKEAISINFNEVEEKADKENGWENVLKYFNVIPFIINNSKKTSIIEYTTMMQKLILLYYLKVIVPHHPEKKDKYTRILNKNGIYMTIDSNPLFTLGKSKNKFLLGHFENPLYFNEIRELLLEEFTPKFDILSKNMLFYQEILNSNSVCVTINKGDFTEAKSKSIYQVCTEEYFYAAMKEICHKVYEPKFFIFSDDIAWVKQNMHFDYKVLYETGNDPLYEKLRLMYSCKHFIISNSTFSWWAQYLGRYKNKVVVSPNRWFKNNWESDLIDPEWILIDINQLPNSKLVVGLETKTVKNIKNLQKTDEVIAVKEAEITKEEDKSKKKFGLKRAQKEEDILINKKETNLIDNIATSDEKVSSLVANLNNIQPEEEKNIVPDNGITEIIKKVKLPKSKKKISEIIQSQDIEKSHIIKENQNIEEESSIKRRYDDKKLQDIENNHNILATDSTSNTEENLTLEEIQKAKVAAELKNLNIPEEDRIMTDTEEIEKLKARYTRNKRIERAKDMNNINNSNRTEVYNSEFTENNERGPMQRQSPIRRERQSDLSSIDSSIEKALQERLREEKSRLQKDKQRIRDIRRYENNNVAKETIDIANKTTLKNENVNQDKSNKDL